VSTKSDKTVKKILALVKGGEDIVFLSDLKLNSESQTHAIHDIEKKLFNLNFKLIYNSTTSSRGVGILIKKEHFKNGPRRKEGCTKQHTNT
jgi:hypothetical protein